MAKPRVIISVRVSSKEQQEQCFGHANQLRRLPELVKEQGWEIAKRPDGTAGIYDEGFASTTAAEGDDLSLESRQVMQALLAELPHVQPTYLVCREVDRIHRSTLEWELLQHALVRAGVEGIVQFPSLDGAPLITRLSESKDLAFAWPGNPPKGDIASTEAVATNSMPNRDLISTAINTSTAYQLRRTTIAGVCGA